MPRNMSFFLTQEQIRNRTKTVTRRLGWETLRPGDIFWGVVKAQGLKKGEKVQRLALLRCVSNRPDRLFCITSDDVRREGFQDLTPEQFVAMFCKHMRVLPAKMVNRIEFEYVDPPA